jgi:hypothetical protein
MSEIDDVEKAHALLAEKKKEKIAKCSEAITRALEAYGCRMEPQVTMRDQSMIWQFVITPKD